MLSSRMVASTCRRHLSRHLILPLFTPPEGFNIPLQLKGQYSTQGTMNPKSKTIALFEEAMQKIYGPYPTDTPDPGSWQPPTKPGAGGHRGRYLWTDAFGVINFITLSREKDGKYSRQLYLGLAKRLTETVHSVLGRTRDLTSPLPGATDEEPLKGGLRIGKLDADGPDGDGQYHHYLTLWMFALNQLSLATDEPHWNVLAVQLAKAIHPHFMTEKRGQESMVWKISMDLRNALVNSKGNLDDIDGLVVYQLLQETTDLFSQRRATNGKASTLSLDAEIEHYRRIMDTHSKSLSGDPLDLGMSLWISHFDREATWSRELAGNGLAIARGRFLPAAQSPVTAGRRPYRLAFREFGACLGIKCYVDDPEQPLHAGAEVVLDAWQGKLLDAVDEDLRPINLVMYAAALIPGAFHNGYVGLETVDGDRVK